MFQYFRLIVAVYYLTLSPLSQANHTLTFSSMKDSATAQIAQKVLSRAYDALGYKIQKVEWPSARALANANNGYVDGELMRIRHGMDRYSNLIEIPIPFCKVEVIAFGLGESDIRLDSWESLYPYHIGMAAGLLFSRNAIESHPDLKYTLQVTPTNLFKMLKAGRIDYVIMTKMSGFYRLNLMGLKEIKPVEGPIESHQVYHYLHKKHRDLANRLAEQLTLMRDNGELQPIITQYKKEVFRGPL